MQPIITDFGTLTLGGLSIPLRIYGYGLMLVLGFLLAVLLAQRRARRVGENPEVLSRCGILALIGGIAGSRIAYVIQHWDTHFAREPNPLAAVLNISSGGLIYYGGVVLATAMVLAYLRFKKLPVRRHLDILAISMMVGLAFGRAGCLLNGCCYGARSDARWALGMRFGMYSPPLLKLDGRENPYSVGTESPSPVYAHQMDTGQVTPPAELTDEHGWLIPPREFTPAQIAAAQRARSEPVQPAQALSIVNALLIAGLLAAFFRLRRREGQVFALMLLMYPVTRFVLESIRDDNHHDLWSGVLTHNQYTSVGMFLAGAAMMWALTKLPASAGPAWPQRLAAEAAATNHRTKRSKKP